MRIFNIGDYQLTHSPDNYGEAGVKECLHSNVLAEDAGEIIRCKDCGMQLSAYWLLMKLTKYFADEREYIAAQRAAYKQDQEKGLTLKAAQDVEHAWRSHKYIPQCPHCHEPITPRDGFGNSKLSKNLAEHQAKPLEMLFDLRFVETSDSGQEQG
jgi:hypothetical protein